ncbi:biotin/lipoyl-binding protein [bacterium]|nr:biotin/lipoyl-binding protein [bacterium]
MMPLKSSMDRLRQIPSLMAIGAALFFITWLTAGTLATARSDRDPGPASPPQDRHVVGFGHVDVEGGTVPLSAAIPGQIEEVLVKEGERVRAGQVLARLKNNQAVAQLAEAEAAVEHAEIERRQADRSAEEQSIRRKLQEQAIRTAENRVRAGNREVSQLQTLAGDDVVPAERVKTGRDIATNLQSALEAEQLKLRQLDLVDSRETVQLAELALRLARAKRDQAEDYLDRHSIVAPADGLVLRVMLSAGQMTGPGPAPIWFAPDRPRVIRCEIDQAFADRVVKGRVAQIVDDRAVGQQWTGVVSRCGDWIAPRRSMLDEPFQRNDVRTLECVITLDPGQAEVRIGQRMRVVITELMAATTP